MHVFAHNDCRSSCGLQCAECKDFSVCAGSQVERGNLCNSNSTLEVFCWENREGGYTLTQFNSMNKCLLAKLQKSSTASLLHILSASHIELQTDFTFFILLDSLTAYRLVMSNLPEAMSALWFQLFLCKNRNPWITQLVMSDDSTIQVL